MNFNYTISSLGSLRELPNLTTAQFTLNSRTFPSKRKCVANLKEMENVSDADIIIHYDFIYIISRYLFFTDEVQNAVLNELADILRYSVTNKKILGVVMHTDWPIKKSVYSCKNMVGVVDSEYTSKLWDVLKIKENLLELGSLDKLLSKSMYNFFSNLDDILGNIDGCCKVYVENTTHIPHNMSNCLIPGTLEYLEDFYNSIRLRAVVGDDKCSRMLELMGICVDTEHYFAIEGKFPEIITNIPCIYHVNAIPKEVKPCSGRDLHSNTTLFSCSQHDFSFYVDYTKKLDSLKIPYVREVKEETMKEEMDLINKDLYGC